MRCKTVHRHPPAYIGRVNLLQTWVVQTGNQFPKGFRLTNTLLTRQSTTHKLQLLDKILKFANRQVLASNQICIWMCFKITERTEFRVKPCSMPQLPSLWSHKLSVWPPCGAVLAGGMHNLSLIPLFKWMLQNLLNLSTAYNISCQQWHNYATPWLTLRVVFTFHQSCALLLCYSLLAKHGSQSSGLLQSLLFVMFWLAEAIHVTGSLEPSTEQCDSALSQIWGINLTSYHCIVYVHCCWLIVHQVKSLFLKKRIRPYF